MKVRLFLRERGNIPTYDHARDRGIDGEWERGWSHIEVPLREGEHNPQLQGYHGDIEGPICIPTSDCRWWAPLRGQGYERATMDRDPKLRGKR